MYWQKPKLIGPDPVVLQGNSEQEKQWLTPLFEAQVDILQNSFFLGRQPASPLGHAPLQPPGADLAGNCAYPDQHRPSSSALVYRHPPDAVDVHEEPDQLPGDLRLGDDGELGLLHEEGVVGDRLSYG